MPGWNKFGPNNHGEESTQQEHGKGEPEIHRTNVLVVGREQPTRHARWQARDDDHPSCSTSLSVVHSSDIARSGQYRPCCCQKRCAGK